MTITILPPAKTQFSDSNGVPLAGGSVYMYVPNSSAFKTTWQDSGGTIPNANPIPLDSAGECLLWGSGAYRQLVQDSLGNTVWDQITEDPGFAVAASFGGTSTTSVAIGTGSKTFTTQTGLQFFPGATVNIASAASALNYMNGTVTSYDTATGILIVNVLTDGGSGTHADWNIAVSGIQGPAGTVTGVSVATANGFSGTSSGGGTPQLTLTTSVTGVVKGNGTALSPATSGMDYSAGTSSLATGILKSTTSTGALSIALPGDFPILNQNTTGTAANVTTNANLTGPITSVGNATTIQPSVVTEAMLNISNNTTANVTTSAHGFAPALPNDATKFFNGVGSYTAPPVSLTIGTSATSLTIGTGPQTYTTQSGLAIVSGQFIVTPSSANANNYMFGQVTSYSGTTLVLNITATGGSGTHTDWNIVASGPQGPAGSGSGIVNSGTGGQLTYYGATGTTVSGNTNATISIGAMTLGNSGVQGSLILSGSTSGATAFVPASAASGTITIPSVTSTMAVLGSVQTFTAAQTFSSSDFLLAGSGSGTTTINASAVASGVITVPATTDTLVGKATTDTFTNKTFDTAGTGNSLKINGQAILSVSGNTSKVGTVTGSLTSGHLATFDASGNLQDGGAVPTAGVAYGSISGCLLSSIAGSSTTATITIGSGQATNSANTAYISSAGYSWAASNGNAINGTDAASSTLGNSTTYHMFLCSGGSGTGTFASASLTPTFPTGYTASNRRIGSFNTNSSGAPIPYFSIEVEGGASLNWLTTQVLDVSVINLGTSRTLYPLTVPSGIKVQPIIRATSQNTGQVILTSPDESDIAPASSATTVPLYDFSFSLSNSENQAFLYLTTNTSRQIGARCSTTGGSLNIVTRGFRDYRRT